MLKQTIGFIAALSVAAAAAVTAAADTSGLEVSAEVKSGLSKALDEYEGKEVKGFSVSGYDLSTASELREVSLSELLASGDVSGAAAADPYYIVSFESSDGKGDAYIARNADGELAVTDTAVYTDAEAAAERRQNPDHAAISKVLDNYSGVSDVMLLQDADEYTELVFFRSEGKELYIPLFYGAGFDEYSKALPANRGYTVTELSAKLGNETAVKDAAGGAGVTLKNDKAPEAQPLSAATDEEKTSPVPFIIAGAAVLAAAAAFLAAKLLRRSR